MRKQLKRWCSLLLTLVMVVSLLPTAVLAADGEAQTATLVTDASTLKVGDEVVIVAKDYDYALGTNQKTNNREATAITKQNDKLTLADSVQKLTLEAGTKDGTFAFSTGSGYLYAAGQSKAQGVNKNQNYLKTEATITNNSSWKIEISNEGTANIVAQGENGCNILQYNTSTLFSAYASDQQPISLYKLTAAKEKVATPTANVINGAEIEVGTQIAFECATEGAKLYYKTAGTDYQEYTGPIAASQIETYTVKAMKDGMDDSAELTVSVVVYELVDKYVKADTIATDDQVVIYNAGNGFAVAGEMKGSYYLTPVAATVDENALTADSFNTLVWTVTKNEDNTYTFTQGTDTTLTMGTSNGKFNLNLTGNGAAKWDVEACNAENASYYMSGNGVTGQYGKVYMEYYAKYTEFSAYCTSTDRLTEKDFGMTFYKLTQEKHYIGGLVPPPTPTQQVATPTASPAADEVAKGTKVTFSCATEDATILYATDGTTFTEGTEVTVNENVTFTVKATKAGMDDSDVATFAYTVKDENPVTSRYAKLTNELADGDQFVVYYNKDSAVMTNTASGKGLSGTDATLTGEFVALTDAMSVLTARKNADGQYTFANEAGKYLTSGATGNSLTFADAESQYSLWTIEAATGGFHIVNVNAVYVKDGVSNKQALEVYNGVFTTFSEKDTDYYLFNLYKLTDEKPGSDEPSGDLPKPGDKFVIYNQNAQAVLAAENDSKSIEKAAATIENGEAVPANGAVVFTVEQNGEYLRFKSEAYGYLCSNGTGNNAFYSKTASDDADWTVRTCSGGVGGYEMEHRTAKYSGHSQWLEYYADAFKTYSMYKVTDYTIYSFFFYPVADGVNVTDGIVNAPAVDFGTILDAYVGQPYTLNFTVNAVFGVDTLTAKLGAEVLTVAATENGYSVTIPTEKVTGDKLTVTVSGQDTKGVKFEQSAEIRVLDEPVISNVKPAQGAQTGSEKRPEISAEISNAGENASVMMTVNGAEVNAAYANGKVTYKPAADMADGKVTVTVTVKRADNKGASKTWSFTVGEAAFQRYFGQLHSHTQYSDGAGSLESALAYIKALPDSANVDFVAFTDHSNYFDKSGAANPEAALYDMTQATAYSQETWKSYKDAVAAFNVENAGSMVALAGFEMTWSGGPGHINTFNTPGIVSRNNTTLNNKTKDAGLQAYYKLLSQAEGANSISQFNHPGTTFGNFIDFGYWDAVVDTRMYMVEVGNGEGQIGAGGYYPSYEQYIMALDKGWHVAPTNNQDNHKGRWGNANDARDVILTDDFSEDGIYSAIRERRMYATEDKNLELDYTVNGNMMGSIIDVPEKLDIEISFNDPDRTDSIAKVELVVNSGKVAHSWSSVAELAKGSVSVTLDPEYTYYFVRVTEGDGDLAVTAPVWVGESLKLGISKAECGTSTPVTGEELTITTTIFNSEAKDATITGMSYTIKDGGAGSIEVDFTERTLAASSTLDVEFKYTPVKARLTTVTIMATVKQDGKDYTFTKDVTLDVLDASKLVYIGIDASHYNEYVAGNYKDSMGNFGELAAKYSVRTVTLKTSEELIAACGNTKYKALILTAPSRRLEAAQNDPKTYSAAELDAIKKFNDAGGTVILAGWSDNYENYDVIKNNPAIKHMAETQNEVLAALGSSLRISDDATYDDVRSAADGVDKWRLYFSTYNMDNPLLAGVEFDAEHPFDKLYTERFSHYGGASVYAVDASGKATSTLPATVSPVVYGHATTYSVDVDSDGRGGAGTPKYVYAENDSRLMVMATEQLEGKGQIIVSGAAFMSNFEVQYQASDNGAEKNYSNYKICENLVSQFNQTEITPIADVQAEPDEGVKFTIEGIVTSNASGYDKDTAFFDCIYVQDDTAGINAFPVAGNFKIGDKVRITGTTSSYQGERQIAVTAIEKIGEAEAPAPKAVTAAQLENKGCLGSLVTVEGTATKIEYSNGLIQTIMVKDASGKEARIFIDGYITTAKDVENASVGCHVKAVGLASYDNTFVLENGTPVYQRIRIRNRADVVCTAATPVTPDEPYVPSTPSKPADEPKPNAGLPFGDVGKSSWFYGDVEYVYEKGIMSGTGETTFDPYGILTRGMIVTIIYRMEKEPAAALDSLFADVDPAQWYGKAVAWAAKNSIVTGYNDVTFGPNDPVTREQLAAILYRYAIYRGMTAVTLEDNLGGFADAAQISAYAVPAMNWAVGKGLLNGTDGLLMPKAQASRAQVAAIIHRYLEG